MIVVFIVTLLVIIAGLGATLGWCINEIKALRLVCRRLHRQTERLEDRYYEIRHETNDLLLASQEAKESVEAMDMEYVYQSLGMKAPETRESREDMLRRVLQELEALG